MNYDDNRGPESEIPPEPAPTPEPDPYRQPEPDPTPEPTPPPEPAPDQRTVEETVDALNSGTPYDPVKEKIEENLAKCYSLDQLRRCNMRLEEIAERMRSDDVTPEQALELRDEFERIEKTLTGPQGERLQHSPENNGILVVLKLLMELLGRLSGKIRGAFDKNGHDAEHADLKLRMDSVKSTVQGAIRASERRMSNDQAPAPEPSRTPG